MPTVRLVMFLLSGDHALCWVFTAVHLIMLHRTILNEGLASSMSYNVFAICRSCFVWVVPTVCLVILLSGGHASCSSCLQYVLQCCCCLETMFNAGHASSTSCNVRNMLRGDLTRRMSCNVVAVCRPCFVQVVPAVCLIILMLSGDHASGGSCQQYVLWCHCCVKTMLLVNLASSMLCDVITIWWLCLVNFVCYINLLLCDDHLCVSSYIVLSI